MADDYEEDGARRTLLESEGNIQYGSNGTPLMCIEQ